MTRDFFPAQLHKLQLSGSLRVATSHGHGTIDLGSETLVPMDLQISACWYTYPSEKYVKVNVKDSPIQNMENNP